MAEDSIAVVDLDRCQPDRCNYECANYCPPNRTGKECITLRGDDAEDGDPDQVRISEEICLGETCGICVEKCPFDAIEIINLPQELEDNPTHRYGENAFSLYGLPVPEPGKVTGLLGPNGIGKSTAVNVLAGEITPTSGVTRTNPTGRRSSTPTAAPSSRTTSRRSATAISASRRSPSTSTRFPSSSAARPANSSNVRTSETSSTTSSTGSPSAP